MKFTMISFEEKRVIESFIQKKEEKFLWIIQNQSISKDLQEYFIKSLYQNLYYHEYSHNYHLYYPMLEEIRYLKKAYGILLRMQLQCISFDPKFEFVASGKYYSFVLSFYQKYREIISSFLQNFDSNKFIDEVYALEETLQDKPVCSSAIFEYSKDIDFISLEDYEIAQKYSNSVEIFYISIQHAWTYEEYHHVVKKYFHYLGFQDFYLQVKELEERKQDTFLETNVADVIQSGFSNISLYEKEDLVMARKILIERCFLYDMEEQNQILASIYHINCRLIREKDSILSKK